MGSYARQFQFYSVVKRPYGLYGLFDTNSGNIAIVDFAQAKNHAVAPNPGPKWWFEDFNLFVRRLAHELRELAKNKQLVG